MKKEQRREDSENNKNWRTIAGMSSGDVGGRHLGKGVLKLDQARTGQDVEDEFRKRTGRSFDDPTPTANRMRRKHTGKHGKRI
jgi:hypothetical protein